MPEIRRVRRRSAEIRAAFYDGALPIGFLEPDESASPSIDEPEALVILKGGKVKLTAVPGEWLIRVDGGEIVAMPAAEFERQFEEVTSNA